MPEPSARPAPLRPAMLSVAGLNAWYGESHVLHGVDLEVRDGEVVPGKRMSITLCSDHRIVNGAEAAQFLARVRELLESPFSLAF